MKHFFNEELGAPNVLKVPVDVAAVRELLPLWETASRKRRLYRKLPAWHSDVTWLSARSTRDFEAFQRVFQRLDVTRYVEEYLDLDRAVRLYCGFLVVRRRCTTPNFHVDWAGADNNAFTLLTPVTDNCSGFGLLYRRADGSVAEYDYKPGEALILGDGFVHSTKPGTSDQPVVLLSFTFGSDKMEHWPNIARTAARQSLLVCRPDGSFQRLPIQARARNALFRLRRALRSNG